MSTKAQAPAADNVIVLTPRNEGSFAHTLYKEDAAELLQLSREFSEGRRRWEEKRDYVKAALRGGARIEPGAFTFELVTSSGGRLRRAGARAPHGGGAMIRTVALLLCIFAAPPVFAQKALEKEFAAQPQKVFDAALQVVKAHYTVVDSNREDGILRFKREKKAGTKWGLKVTFTVRNGQAGGTTAKVDASKDQATISVWGADSRFEKEFMEQLEAELRKMER